MSDIRILNAEAILQADDLPRELVEVPEWGGAVYVRGLTGAERGRLENALIDQPAGKRQGTVRMDMETLRMRVAAWCMVDEDGNRLFSDKQVDALGAKSGTALQRVFDVAQRLSGMTAEDAEELEGN